MDIAKEISKEVDLKFSIENGKVGITTGYEGKGGGAELKVFVSAEYFLDKLAEAIPGQIDDLVIDALKSALIK